MTETVSRAGRLMTMTAHAGRGEELAALLLRVAEGLRGFPGCRTYVVAREADAPDTVRVFEVWDDEASAQAALRTEPTAEAPGPQDVLALLATPPSRTDLAVLGGVGLPPSD
ncbi:antibiotic biosynthesis monooxygenase [Streptomyces sp. 3MP-14]|uniref:Antibiotic biosynthesis monooxygenase n=1 Tax=Streptomyces mimosae TaxID=2586635 RepID=A0A5N6ADK7_9ACTN|nr:MULTISPECIES: antibiotic biosynthesis monooxygenase family protein [Streptomyces]KAB8166325.1 antibiotic biosynthesis monooxygenase [Streptomyces mimosae]KAB8174118.1 antibiotic biosynthesis monooxygenase [Streptomyces sp. 3MP-14]